MERPVVTVGALIENPRGELLLVRTHKWRGKLGVPGGKIERGETQEAALVRELREETGLAVRDVAFLLAQDCIDSPEFHRPAHMVLLNYHCRADSDAVTLDDEAEAYLWVRPEAALALDLNAPTRALVEDYLRVSSRTRSSSD